MPPKKKSEPGKKTVEKKKEKVIEDKTFGLKNKKGKKQQQFIKQVSHQVKYGHSSAQKLASDQYESKKKRDAELEKKREMETLFRPIAGGGQKISAGADPKSVLCVFFRQGMCSKGDKCKFSHDLTLEGKAEKKSMYVDARDLEEDTIDKWDEDKLKEVVEKKHGGKVKPKTDIVCKFFLQAIESGKYGWFWDCPNSDKCIYRHALPPGFVFKTSKKNNLDEEEKISIEKLVEEEREKLIGSGKNLTKVTLETFLAWKSRKLKEKQANADEEAAKRKEAFKAGKTHGISGREMFEFNPDMVDEDGDDDDDEAVVISRTNQEDEDGALLDVTNFTIPDGLPVIPPVTRLEERELVDAVGGAGISNQNISRGAVGMIQIDENLFTEDYLHDDEELINGVTDELKVDEELFDVDDDELLILEEELQGIENAGDCDTQSVGSD